MDDTGSAKVVEAEDRVTKCHADTIDDSFDAPRQVSTPRRRAARLGLEATRHETYGEWLRRVDPSELSLSERATMEAEREWEVSHRDEVHRLLAMVGCEWRLRSTMRTVALEMEPGASSKPLPRAWGRGTHVFVFARVGACLLGETITGVTLLLEPDWLEEAKEVATPP